VSKLKISFFYLTKNSKLTFRTKFKNSECNIFGPMFCNNGINIFNIKLLDSLKIVTVRERISQIFFKISHELTKEKKTSSIPLLLEYHQHIVSVSYEE